MGFIIVDGEAGAQLELLARPDARFNERLARPAPYERASLGLHAFHLDALSSLRLRSLTQFPTLSTLFAHSLDCGESINTSIGERLCFFQRVLLAEPFPTSRDPRSFLSSRVLCRRDSNTRIGKHLYGLQRCITNRSQNMPFKLEFLNDEIYRTRPTVRNAAYLTVLRSKAVKKAKARGVTYGCILYVSSLMLTMLRLVLTLGASGGTHKSKSDRRWHLTVEFDDGSYGHVSFPKKYN